ncbi:MAG: Periplasmic immunogenic protein [Phycisphaerales bacterium]|nr:Periplasmic immunogenic protein [Phycisphaerales bacterium]MDB5357615.1 Periplasmic immunogenic protein [Phycisphaerales bacterium]
MRKVNSSIETAEGVRVFGSSIIRVSPDSAAIAAAISTVAKEPKTAFTDARASARTIHAWLHQAAIKDFGASRLTLSQEFRFKDGENRFMGYRARIGYNIILHELDRIEEVLAGLVGAGANELTSVTFQTTRLKEVRADARRRAVAAARDKADLYCNAAGVAVGAVLAIEDVSPEVLSGRQEGHVYREPAMVDDVGDSKAIDPGAIPVAAAVNVVYAIVDPTMK